MLAGRATIGSFLDLIAAFADESSPAVWSTIVTGLSWCDRFLDGAPRERFRDMVRDLVQPAMAAWAGRPGTTTTRSTASCAAT